MNIPFLDLKAQYRSIREEVNQKILQVLESQRFILGEEVSLLEEEIADYCGGQHAVGVSSGSDALIISLMALGIGEGDFVITTPFTFFATAGAVARLGAVPLFCDIQEDSCNLDPALLNDLLARKVGGRDITRVKAIIPVHLYGQVADMDPIQELSRQYDIAVLEDAAQAIGSEYPGNSGVRKACSLGDLGILSFFPSKNLGGYGDGGMVLTDDANLAEKLKLLRIHGSCNKYFYEMLGGNFRLDALQAAVLRVKLPHLDEWHSRRQQRADYYRKGFTASGLLEKGAVTLPVEFYRDQGVKNYHTYHQYVIRTKDRDALQAYLKKQNIPTAVYYPLGLHLQQCFSSLGYKRGDFPVTEKVSGEVLALPIYPELSDAQQDHIIAAVEKFFSGK